MDRHLRFTLSCLAAGLAAADLYRRVGRPRSLWWGATETEIAAALPGDNLIADPVMVTTHAVTIDAPPSAVWPWLVQMGPGRGGAYTYDWVENLFGLNMHSADRIVPEWQHMAVGDAFPLSKDGPPLHIEHLASERAMVAATPDRTWSGLSSFSHSPAVGPASSPATASRRRTCRPAWAWS
jgi:hypothetical protein